METLKGCKKTVRTRKEKAKFLAKRKIMLHKVGKVLFPESQKLKAKIARLKKQYTESKNKWEKVGILGDLKVASYQYKAKLRKIKKIGKDWCIIGPKTTQVLRELSKIETPSKPIPKTKRRHSESTRRVPGESIAPKRRKRLSRVGEIFTPNLLKKAKSSLRRIYLTSFNPARLTPSERTEFTRRNGNAVQVMKLLPTFKGMFKKTLDGFGQRGNWNSYRSRVRMLNYAVATWGRRKKMTLAQKKFWAEEIRKGNLIKMKADDPKMPYFCQQVGKGGGVGNNPEMMYMSKEFLPFLKSMVKLVNYQVDLFNKNPGSYGFPGYKLPHISALKISGALRTFAHYARLRPRRVATKDFSVHMSGKALDIGAKKSGNSRAAMARLKSDFKVRGVTILRAGEKLKVATGNRHINNAKSILHFMIGRSIKSILPQLQQKGYVTAARWERSVHNWHVVLRQK